LNLSSAGITLSADHERVVRSEGYGDELAQQVSKDKYTRSMAPADPALFEETLEGSHLWLYDIPVATEGENAGKPLEGKAYYKSIPQEWINEWKDKEITRADWRPDDPELVTKEFRGFINSSIPQFDQLKPYLGFFLYIEQARRWLEDKRTLSDIDPAERYEWKKMEYARVADNTLYGLNKYITVKEDGFVGGRRKYEASAPQALLAFIADLGKSSDLLKGRQSAITTSVMAMAAIRSVTVPSFTGVFMVHKKDGTGKTLFRDKFQSTFQHLPKWMLAGVDVSKSFSAESAIMDFDKGDTKITKGMDVSEMRLLSAEDSMAVNGRTPTWSLFDECQNIPTYQTIKGEIDPSMFQFNIKTGKMDLVRQILAWGTGSSNNTGNGAFENDFRSLLEAWEGGEDTAGWTPLFFDWTCRPGMTKAFYLKQKAKYLRGQTEETKGLTPTERLALFNAHYPRKPDDAFMITHRTLIPMELIVRQQNRIMDMCHKKGLGPVYGSFVPIFNESITLPETCYFPHPVIGATWKPAHADEVTAPIKMFLDANNSYTNRNFHGTDPINNDGGHSKFSGCIIDMAAKEIMTNDGPIYVPTIACMLNARTAFPKDLYVQNILMGIYYRNHGQKACKELVEINAGQRYVDFKCGPEFNLRESLVERARLPLKYRGGTHLYGLDLKGGKDSRKDHLYGDITDFLRTNWYNIWYYDIWTQIRRMAVVSQPDGSVKWGAQAKNVDNDDMVYAMGYADVCAKAFDAQPKRVDAMTKEYRTVRKVVRDSNHMPKYQYERVEVTHG